MTGYFSAGALIQLADNAATALSLRTAKSRGYDGFPYSVQMNAQLVSNTNSGRAIARAAMASSGRSVMAAETRVTDESGKLLLLLTSTHVVRSMTPKPE
jgi:acyl-coenzyme A thioesterase PaaI-like protein